MRKMIKNYSAIVMTVLLIAGCGTEKSNLSTLGAFINDEKNSITISEIESSNIIETPTSTVPTTLNTPIPVISISASPVPKPSTYPTPIEEPKILSTPTPVPSPTATATPIIVKVDNNINITIPVNVNGVNNINTTSSPTPTSTPTPIISSSPLQTAIPTPLSTPTQSPSISPIPTATPIAIPTPKITPVISKLAFSITASSTSSEKGISINNLSDNNVFTYWGSGSYSPAWIKLTSDSKTLLTAIKIIPHSTPAGQCFLDLLGSNDDMTYENIKENIAVNSPTAIDSNEEFKSKFVTIPIEQSKEFKYYKLALKNWGNGKSWIAIGELELHGYKSN